jgi:hypothetical protein
MAFNPNSAPGSDDEKKETKRKNSAGFKAPIRIANAEDVAEQPKRSSLEEAFAKLT